MTAKRTERNWLDSVRTLLLRGEAASAQNTLNLALAEFPQSADLLRIQAGILRQTGQETAAERIFRELLTRNPGDTGSAFAFAHALKERGQTASAARVLRACLDARPNRCNAELAIKAIEWLDDIGRKRDASAVAESAVVAHPEDPRLHAYAGMIEIQLGAFERARRHYLVALDRDPRAFEWHVPIGLSSTLRYDDPTHPDFALFRAGLQRTDLSDLARAELHFALGKAHDDISDYAHAAQHFRQGNAIRKCLAGWSRKTWRRAVEARLASKSVAAAAKPADGFTPVFIVGMPRTGTTLLAELLSRSPDVCNRGELPWLARLAQQTDLSDPPDLPALRRAACRYMTQARQDDAPDARWFLDKQPLNFRYVDLALAMFPDARIVHCRRNTRDTALSLWTQCFLEDVQGYAYDFDDIALVMRDEQRLMAHWRELYPGSIRTVRYEELVAAPQATIAASMAWIGMTKMPLSMADVSTEPANFINTASLWQARQPIHGKSINRWEHYAPFVPELSKLREM